MDGLGEMSSRGDFGFRSLGVGVLTCPICCRSVPVGVGCPWDAEVGSLLADSVLSLRSSSLVGVRRSTCSLDRLAEGENFGSCFCVDTDRPALLGSRFCDPGEDLSLISVMSTFNRLVELRLSVGLSVSRGRFRWFRPFMPEELRGRALGVGELAWLLILLPGFRPRGRMKVLLSDGASSSLPLRTIVSDFRFDDGWLELLLELEGLFAPFKKR